MLIPNPLLNTLKRRSGGTIPEITTRAIERWEIAPASEYDRPPVIILPGQVDRIIRTEFGSLEGVLATFQGDPHQVEGPTFGYRLRHVDFIDGVLTCSGAELHLRKRRSRYTALAYIRPREHISGALYESWIGNRWFGNWLMNDCLTYRLAEAHGQPVTSAPEPRLGHAARYGEKLDMTPLRLSNVHFDELILFEDVHNNAGRLARAQDMRKRLLAGLNPQPSPGVFILRGESGDARLMRNEIEIAERLEAEYGFRVIYPFDHSVDDIAEACGGTRIIAGVEGSHLVHGLATMPAGGTVLTLQPDDRVTTSLKLISDRWQQRYAMIIGKGGAEGFEIDWTDVQRTLDLMDHKG